MDISGFTSFLQIVTSNRGQKFVAEFTYKMCMIAELKWKLSTSAQSQSIGQIKNYHEWLDQRPRQFINHYQDNWLHALPGINVAQTSNSHDALGGLTPFGVSHEIAMPLTTF